MCNLYSLTRSQEAMRRLFAIKRDLTGNLASMPAIYPDMLAPVVRIAKDGERQLEMMRWGFRRRQISAPGRSAMSATSKVLIGAPG